ncbi:hypothetical protein [Chryseobacterium sp. ON_d1]|uniref:hypothetical protein n=1 Tax=Chryseobacterium sp. ON_d1 TaxID=2583211 RepID=UPI00115B8ED2|nr:hypothetical protein [Chryseobacterium sp. ON_d1]GEJ46978.1 hypothetical protein CRS_35860 [Chryseobacterium sp. ON_d1]
MNNISIDEEFSQEFQSSEKFQKILDIAKLNLEDYNARMNTSYDLTYKDVGEEKFRFTLDDSDNYQDGIAGDVNFFVLWNAEKIDKSYFEIFYQNIGNYEYGELSFYNSPHVNKDEVYQKKVTEFKKKYDDYSPLGFLTDEESQSVKSEIN